MSSMTGPRPLTLALAADHELVMKGVAAMLAAHADRVRIVDLSAPGAAAGAVDAILVDPFPSEDGPVIDLTPLTTTAAKIVAYSWRLHPTAIALALARGVDGYLSKTLPATDLVQAIEAIRDGDIVISPPEDQADGFAAGVPGYLVGLSPREAEAVELIVQGLSNQEIAEQSYLSINTIKSNIRAAYEKMGVETRSQAVAWGINHGFDPEPAGESEVPAP